MDTLQDPTPEELADAWRDLLGAPIDPDRLDALAAAIRRWPTGRLATAGRPHLVVSWQRVGGSVYVTFRPPDRP